MRYAGERKVVEMGPNGLLWDTRAGWGRVYPHTDHLPGPFTARRAVRGRERPPYRLAYSRMAAAAKAEIKMPARPVSNPKMPLFPPAIRKADPKTVTETPATETPTP